MFCIDDDTTVTPTTNLRWQNFVKTIDYTIPQHFTPTSLKELVWVVKSAEDEGRRLKAVGSGWSIENIATSNDWVVDISRLSATIDDITVGTGRRALHEYWRDASRANDLAHVQAGIKIIDLNRRLGPRRALETLGGAQGQTLAGALSTGTHGSDIEFGALPDLVQAVHLVTTGGQEVWVESERRPLTHDDDALLEHLDCCEHIQVIRDDDAFDAVCCGLGRFGVVYSVVLRVTDSFRLSEFSEYLNWSDVSAALTAGIGRGNMVPQSAHLGSINTLLSNPPWDLRISVSPTEYRYLDLAFNTRKMDQCWVRRRWLTREDGDINMAASDNPLCHPTVANLILAGTVTALMVYAGALAGSVVFAWKAAEIGIYIAELQAMALDPHMKGGPALAACVNAIHRSQLFGNELDWLVDEISQEALSGSLGASSGEGKRGASWQVTAGTSETAFQPDCYNGSSIELVFSLETTAYIDFINEIRRRAGDFVQLGYVSVRFTRGTKALMSMHHVEYPMACAIEVTSLNSLSGTQPWLRWLLQRGKELGGRPHWGQQNDLRAFEVESLYESSLQRWREQLVRIAGTSQTFSNDYTFQRGLEPRDVRRRITGARRVDGAITHLCGEGAYWSPVTVEQATTDMLFGGITYFTAAPDGSAEQTLVRRQVLTTAADDTTANNLSELPDAASEYPVPPLDRTELRVTSVIRSDGRFPSIRYLANDAEGWSVHWWIAFSQIRGGSHHYYIQTADGERTNIRAIEYLTTEADGVDTNNLSTLPDC